MLINELILLVTFILLVMQYTVKYNDKESKAVAEYANKEVFLFMQRSLTDILSPIKHVKNRLFIA